MPSPSAVIVLAAGQGTRMKSTTPKVMHPLGGRSLLHHALEAAAGTGAGRLVVVLRHQRDLLAEHLDGLPEHISGSVAIADQDEIPGTGRATECALARLPEDLDGTVLVTYGDVPLLSAATLRELTEFHETGGHGVSVLTARVPDPTGYGRIVRDAGGGLAAIVEQKDASAEERAITEINSGIYAFRAATLRAHLPALSTDNAQGEKYLTDVIGLAREAGESVAAMTTQDLWQVEGVNDRVQLARLGKEFNRRLLEHWMREGVTIVDPDATWVDAGVRLAQDVTVLPGSHLQGDTVVGAGSVIGPDTTLRDARVDVGATVTRSHVQGAVIGAGATVGPFSYLRPGTDLGQDGKIGAFAETKNAQIGTGSKVPHLSYVGDAEIGEHSNIGCGTVFVNYDGVSKHRTRVGSHVRIGSDTMLIAPVTVGDGAYSGAGTVIRKDVPPGALALNVAPQRNLEGWVEQKRPGSAAAQAASSAREAEQSGTSPAAPDGQAGTRAQPQPHNDQETNAAQGQPDQHTSEERGA
ncbi:bifunctional UDP-N-acetylglucosamine diphosphorylase/glucosamine-1-phosphate N-acetyltransferase GlmU [Sediminivirga luteola]|uniref:Bifunctional protein GlmU n=1 Tax=Sediminivirga luteola TaxID=1774748 RepID=A0A8J2TZ32_9MICO|nr:bifunctional UDP-N-acetylglucosamine diphosphorylase/glucosamine-1-phosphate N-acetyltransferase GlmU [Sediminivirga luteola]MCI2266695.1 bifunctional UDP-N-acetylglucosamine diphosphorylase/glucosamine-1-phosphate N-acetyltransferase GlmU [Sediminivirga luteola]GGA19133.1 bifunctional protein GlmU [Sediminivirga luteola]